MKINRFGVVVSRRAGIIHLIDGGEDFGFWISEKNSNGERWGPPPVRRVNGIFSGVKDFGVFGG